MFCPNCGTKLSNNTYFCPNCGTHIQTLNINKIDEHRNNKNYKKIIFLCIFLCFIIIGVSCSLTFFNKSKKNNKVEEISSIDKSLLIAKSDNGIPKFIDGDFAGIKINNEEDIFKALDSIKDIMKIKDPRKEFILVGNETNAGITYYTLNQMYDKVKVYNNELKIAVEGDKVTALSGCYIPNIDIKISPNITREEAEKIVKDKLRVDSEIIDAQMYIYADNKYKDLVYVMHVYSNEIIKEFIVNANNGDILSEVEIVNYAMYEFRGAGIRKQADGINSVIEEVTIEEFYDLGLLKNRYRLVDPKRNITIVDGRQIGQDLGGIVLSGLTSSWTPMVGDLEGTKFKFLDGQGGNDEMAKIGLTTLKNFEEIYDYYKNVLGRDSYDNKGSKIVINIGVRDKTFGTTQLENAAWLSATNQMYIGYYKGISFAVSKDVLAHEFTHGVISRTAKFASSPKREDRNKAFESGALNEGISDVLGSLIEGKNWTINEDISTIRSLSSPNSYNQPNKKGGKFYFPDGYVTSDRTLEQFLSDNGLKNASNYDNGGIHQNATVVGHAAYLMYQKGAFTSREEMAKIWYNALFIMSPYSDFEDCALAVIKSAKNYSLPSSAIKKIEEAFMETNMLEDKRATLTGTVKSGTEQLVGVQIKISELKSNTKIAETTTNKDGSFEIKLTSNTYRIEFIKDNYEKYEMTVSINNDTKIDVNLIKISDEGEKENETIKGCQSGNCHKLTVYYLDNFDETNTLDKKYETYIIDDGTILGVDTLISDANKGCNNCITTDGKNFKISMSGITIDFAWYYKGTDNKFDFTKPIKQDTEIEMKLFSGFMDSDVIQDIYDKFN